MSLQKELHINRNNAIHNYILHRAGDEPAVLSYRGSQWWEILIYKNVALWRFYMELYM